MHSRAAGNASSLASPIGGPAALAHAVRPVRHTSERGVHLGQVAAHLTDEGADLRALEGDRGALGVVLVVGVGVERGGHHGVVVAGEARQPRLRLRALVGEPSSYVLHPAIVAHATDSGPDDRQQPSTGRILMT